MGEVLTYFISMRMINGMQEVAIGVSDAKHAFNWYRKNFGADIVVAHHNGPVLLMDRYIPQPPQNRESILALNMQGGAGFKIWQYSSRIPQPPLEPIRLGDPGIFAVQIRCKDVRVAYKQYQQSDVNVLSAPEKNSAGEQHFFIKDPYDNIFDIIEDDYRFDKTPDFTGGIRGIMVGVTDINESIAFYKTVLGYDHIISKTAGIFDDFACLNGGEHIFKRALLSHRRAPSGAFGKLLGPGYVELVEVQSRIAKKIYADRYWGDLGFIHVSYDVTGMKGHEKVCYREGHPFTVDSESTVTAGDAEARFAFNEDPDGTLIKYVEPHKLLLLKNLWKLDLTKRIHEKPLPDWVVKCLRFKRCRKKI